ncbi:hypothetical protein BKN38_09260 [Helicobacter sp. CLO-3]|uniref:hypothetical protein n=1 Tax=Helicobacter sp. CLO-3 TaxID=211 RepID=UPI0008D97C23|nr:hypothetical protein [Helicobacter sp. CLO-3]OHU81321.1 hypothetical protein BKN38_09260 [Helicobacter sp. CLO-3]
MTQDYGLKNELIEKYSEMAYEERKFVLDSIALHKPKKILEVGIAAGANSALILNFLKQQDMLESTQLFSCDYNETYYRDLFGWNLSADESIQKQRHR